MHYTPPFPADAAAASVLVFFFNDTATTEIYTLSLHDALPIYLAAAAIVAHDDLAAVTVARRALGAARACGEIGKHTSELQSPDHLVCRLLLEKKKPQQLPYKETIQRLHHATRHPPD